MHISSTILNSNHENQVKVETDGNAKVLAIHPNHREKVLQLTEGVNFYLQPWLPAFAMTFIEAAKRQIEIQSTEVTVSGEFEGEGEPASHTHYQVKVISEYPEKEIFEHLWSGDLCQSG